MSEAPITQPIVTFKEADIVPEGTFIDPCTYRESAAVATLLGFEKFGTRIKYGQIVTDIKKDRGPGSTPYLISARKEWLRFVTTRVVGILTLMNSDEENQLNLSNAAHATLEGSPYQLTGLFGRSREPGLRVYQTAITAAIIGKERDLTDTMILAKAATEQEILLDTSHWLLREWWDILGNRDEKARATTRGVAKLKDTSIPSIRLRDEINKFSATIADGRQFDLRNIGALLADSRLLVRSVFEKPEIMVGDREKDRINDANTLFETAASLRTQPQDIQLYTRNQSFVRIVPYGFSERSTIEKPVDREEITLNGKPIPKIPAKTAEQIHAEKLARQKAAAEEKIKQEQAEAQRREQHDAPILIERNGLAEQHNVLLLPFQPLTGSPVRKLHIFGGNDSLASGLKQSESLDISDPDKLYQLAQILHSLIEFSQTIGSKEDSLIALTELLEDAEKLRRAYEEHTAAHTLQGRVSAVELYRDIQDDVNWVIENWKAIEDVLNKSKYSASEDTILATKIMLGLEEIPNKNQAVVPKQTTSAEEGSEHIASETSEKDGETKDDPKDLRIELKNLAEQLDWVVLPPETTVKDIVDDVIRYGKQNKRIVDKDKIESERIKTLLDLCKQYGGTLHRSSEESSKVLGDLYYVLVFKGSDGKTYAIAENPIYGNASYVMREDLLPLIPGETVLEASKLWRRDVRDLGGLQIIHRNGSSQTHRKKIESKLSQLAAKPSLK